MFEYYSNEGGFHKKQVRSLLEIDLSIMVYLVREATPDEVQVVHRDLARREQWNPGQYDLKAFLAIDPHGFLVGELDGEIVACISAVQLSPSYGFIGCYICKEEHRGRGYGLQIFQAGQKKLSHLPCIGLDGVPAQVHNYGKMGFLPHFESSRYLIQKSEPFPLTLEERSYLANIKELGTQLSDALIFQQMQQGVQVESYFHSLFKNSDVKGLSYYSDGALAGFGVLRPATEGWRIGPLYANTQSIATILFKALSETVPLNENIYLDIPTNNNSALNLAQIFNMRSTSVCVRMYLGQPPPSNSDNIFSLLSLEVGP